MGFKPSIFLVASLHHSSTPILRHFLSWALEKKYDSNSKDSVLPRANEMTILTPAPLLSEYAHLFAPATIDKPVLDLACGDGHNGVFLATRGARVVLADASEQALEQARKLAEDNGVSVVLWKVDLEKEGENPLRENDYSGLLVFRYLHRPLIPCIRNALAGNGLLIYETYTVDQPRFGRPQNPNFLLKPGELMGWFEDWGIIHHFEGILDNPQRAVAQIVCRKTS